MRGVPLLLSLVLSILGLSGQAAAGTGPTCSELIHHQKQDRPHHDKTRPQDGLETRPQERDPQEQTSQEQTYSEIPFAKQDLLNTEIYVYGVAQANEVLFLTAQEYLKKLKADDIPLESLIVLDELPLVEDLPLVSAIIVRKPLTIRSTHVQLLAEKIGIPLFSSQDPLLDEKLIAASRYQSAIEVNCLRSGCTLSTLLEKVGRRQRPSSVMPMPFDRAQKIIFHRDHDLGYSPRELSGDKYFSLMEFKHQFVDLVPDIAGISSGYFEDFLEHYYFNGMVLKDLQWEMIQNVAKASYDRNEDEVKRQLQKFQQAILSSKSELLTTNVFFELRKSLQEHYGRAIVPFSFRSNNDVEDLLATGLYKSQRVENFEVNEIEKGLRKIWSSLYDYRAFTIRRYWGQREENLSMPVLVHPYLSEVAGHAVGVFKYKASSGLELHLSLVLGKDEKATNPSAKAKIVDFVIRKVSPKTDQKTDQKSTQKKNKEADQQANQQGTSPSTRKSFYITPVANINGGGLRRSTEKSLLDFMARVEPYLVSEFEGRRYAPSSVAIELVSLPAKAFFLAEKIQVLQYKPSFNKEIVASVLDGMITREETDERVTFRRSMVKPEDVMRIHFIRSLSRVPTKTFMRAGLNPDESQEGQGQRTVKMRYALLMENGKPFIVTWDHGETHSIVKERFSKTSAIWYKSGFVQWRHKDDGHHLVFTETSLPEVDRSLRLEKAQELFQTAFARGVLENSELLSGLEDLKANVEFHTAEGVGRLEY